ncbi:hypothetical protein AJ80_09962 [Polytolypa hystricis UAMH7299]|uniref:C2H2-type domain-containing protein n=1 Tax=Polytolypa hystricis (strain UAMH7299) TaxID=1447883 RepID=A0A2B7WFT9_POLH7|nr:hypothetical protein AJ80_09962 [Polytolypa hystricis UAMH7299]
MSVPQSNPRRRFNKSNLPPLSTSSVSSRHVDSAWHHVGPYNMPLRKGATFHASSPPSSTDADPVINIPALPRRSPTCSTALEDILAAHSDRMNNILSDFDHGFLGRPRRVDSSFADDLPLPKGLVPALPHTDAMDNKTDLSGRRATQGIAHLRGPSRHHHPSDSGLGTSIEGSSVADAKLEHEKGRVAVANQINNVAGPPQTAITRSATFNGDLFGSGQPSLGPIACKKIERLILLPIVREKQFAPFLGLIKGIPSRIDSKEIACLRDLEKTLLFLAPVSETTSSYNLDVAHFISLRLKRYAVSRASYERFCEFTIQCIHSTVSYLNEREQCRPTDRPYTSGYFLDLVEQIRRYAAMVRTAREDPAASKEENGMKYSPNEVLTLEGGLSSNGRPVELVRRNKDQSVSLTTGQPYETKSPIPTMKRSLSMESTDDSVQRSMARRKKDAPPLDINKKCEDCGKVFKRPCDYAKHEKTHTRPWKCPEVSCKYHTTGWPTEKECDRHYNDKHSKNPRLYRCTAPGCPYTSKRESNCKQHMEKTHGFAYHRSKNNGKTSKRSSVAPTPQTPSMGTPVSGLMDAPTPMSSHGPSPFLADASPLPSNMQYGQPAQYPLFSPQPGGDFQLYPDNPVQTNCASSTHSVSDFGHPTVGDFELFPTNAGQDNLANFSPFPAPLDFNAFHASLQASDPNSYLPDLSRTLPSIESSSNSTTHDTMATGLGFGSPDLSAGIPDNFEMDWSAVDTDFTALNAQLMSPPSSTDLSHQHLDFSGHPSLCYSSPSLTGEKKAPHLSPNGQGNLMLYTPPSQEPDEGFQDQFDYSEGTTGWY